MNFETIDWELEAQRVTRAFGVDKECAFVDAAQRRKGEVRVKRLFKSVKGVFNQWPHSRQGREIRVEIHSEGMEFHIYCKPESGQYNLDGMAINLLADGSPLFYESYIEPAVVGELARALFHLDLLTPEVEAALKVTVTAHEKIEWAKEYAERYEL